MDIATLQGYLRDLEVRSVGASFGRDRWSVVLYIVVSAEDAELGLRAQHAGEGDTLDEATREAIDTVIAARHATRKAAARKAAQPNLPNMEPGQWGAEVVTVTRPGTSGPFTPCRGKASGSMGCGSCVRIWGHEGQCLTAVPPEVPINTCRWEQDSGGAYCVHAHPADAPCPLATKRDTDTR